MFDMNQCKVGDKLISCHGMIFTYEGIDEKNYDYKHIVRYPDGSIGTRLDDGSVFRYKKLPEDHNIVGFANEF